MNRDSLIKLDDSVYDDNLNTPFRFGFPLDSEINLDNSGLWDTLDNGDRLWRLKIICEDAVSINLIYNHFYLPEQSYFFIIIQQRNIYWVLLQNRIINCIINFQQI
ncbi:hypothetical protein MASR1M45_05370 [Candidatus Kapaibacterium sp.]